MLQYAPSLSTAAPFPTASANAIGHATDERAKPSNTPAALATLITAYATAAHATAAHATTHATAAHRPSHHPRTAHSATAHSTAARFTAAHATTADSIAHATAHATIAHATTADSTSCLRVAVIGDLMCSHNLGDEYETMPLYDWLRQRNICVDVHMHHWFPIPRLPALPRHLSDTMKGWKNFTYTPGTRRLAGYNVPRADYHAIILAPGPWDGLETVWAQLKHMASTIPRPHPRTIPVVLWGGTIGSWSSGVVPPLPPPLQLKLVTVRECLSLQVFSGAEANVCSAAALEADGVRFMLSADFSASFREDKADVESWKAHYTTTLPTLVGATTAAVHGTPIYLIFVRQIEHIKVTPDGFLRFPVISKDREFRLPSNTQKITNKSVEWLQVPKERAVFCTSSLNPLDNKWIPLLLKHYGVDPKRIIYLQSVAQMLGLMKSSHALHVVSDRYHPALAALHATRTVDIIPNERGAVFDNVKMYGLDMMRKSYTYEKFRPMNDRAFRELAAVLSNRLTTADL